jgi:hypothetical protein
VPIFDRLEGVLERARLALTASSLSARVGSRTSFGELGNDAARHAVIVILRTAIFFLFGAGKTRIASRQVW